MILAKQRRSTSWGQQDIVTSRVVFQKLCHIIYLDREQDIGVVLLQYWIKSVAILALMDKHCHIAHVMYTKTEENSLLSELLKVHWSVFMELACWKKTIRSRKRKTLMFYKVVEFTLNYTASYGLNKDIDFFLLK
jgi:hypothetical protein